MSKSAATQARSVEVQEQRSSEAESHIEAPGYTEISELAHQLWIDRGCPEDSPEHDWYRAEEILRSQALRS